MKTIDFFFSLLGRVRWGFLLFICSGIFGQGGSVWPVRNTPWNYYPSINNNLPPNISQQVLCLSGQVKIRGNDTLLIDITNKHDTVKIIGCDWLSDPEYTYKIIPYRTKAVIVFPTGLKQYDVDSFMFAGNGTARQIPVISFFQNIDYANKIFCKEIAQVLNSNLVKIHGTGVTYITIYSSTQTGVNLTTCNTYFNVPTPISGAKYVDYIQGSNNNSGTLNSPWKTMTYAISQVATNGTIYCKTGTYLEDYSGGVPYFYIDKAVKIIGLGNVNITTTSATYGARLLANNIQLTGLSFKQIKTYSLYSHVITGLIINRCNITNTGTYGFLSMGDATITNTIFNGQVVSIYKYSSSTTLEIDGSKIIATYPIMEAETGSQIVTIKNSNLLGTIRTSGNITYTILDSYIQPIAFQASTTGTFHISYSTLEKISLVASNLLDISLCTLDSIIIDNCTFKSAINTLIYLVNQKVIYFRNNKCISQGSGKNVGLAINTVTQPTYFEVNNNTITSTDNSDNSPLINIGTDVASSATDLMTGKIYNNCLFGDLYNNPSSSSTQHALSIFWQNKVNVYNNYIHGGSIGIVFKHESGDLSLARCDHNIVVNCRNHIQLKGIYGLKVYNNTIFNKTITHSRLIYVMANGSYISNHCIIKNNVLFDISSLGTTVCYDPENSTNLTIDHNVVATINNTISGGSFATWQALGYDLNSINVNPLFTDTVNYKLTLQLTSPAIGTGVNLGSSYNTGLDNSTNWGNSIQTPLIVTKQQSSNWDIGAYIH